MSNKKKITYKKQDGNKLKKDLEKIKEINEQSTKGIVDLLTTPSIKRKAMGGDLKTEYRAGGAVNLGNYKGQF